jgi:hypothetical protein
MLSAGHRPIVFSVADSLLFVHRIIFHPEFVTAIIYEWKALLKKTEFQQIVIERL